MKLGEIIYRYRKTNDLTMQEFADKAAISKGYVSMLEKNQHPQNQRPLAPSIITYNKLAAAMGLTLDALLSMLDGSEMINLSSSPSVEIKSNSVETELKELIIGRYGSLKAFTDSIQMPWTTLDSIIKRGVEKANINNILKITNELNIDAESLACGSIVPKESPSSSLSVDSENLIGKRIKSRRQELGMSAEELADKLGVNPSTIYRYESKGIENMKIDKVQPIAQALQVQASYLMGWTDAVFSVIDSELTYIYEQLNAEGQKKLVEYAQDLLSSGRYKKITAKEEA